MANSSTVSWIRRSAVLRSSGLILILWSNPELVRGRVTSGMGVAFTCSRLTDAGQVRRVRVLRGAGARVSVFFLIIRHIGTPLARYPGRYNRLLQSCIQSYRRTIFLWQNIYIKKYWGTVLFYMGKIIRFYGSLIIWFNVRTKMPKLHYIMLDYMR